MNPPVPPPSGTVPPDPDLAEQARPGHGIPSQDPDPAAQTTLTPEESRREAGSVLTGGGAAGGAALGATVGVVVAGPLGVRVGGTLGAVAGAIGGAAVGTVMGPDDDGKAAHTSQGVPGSAVEGDDTPTGSGKR